MKNEGKTVFIIHGYNGVPKIFYWLKDELESKSYEVIMPEFPTQTEISYESWSEVIEPYKELFENKPILVAHSVGNAFMIEYLAKNNLEISTYISLAGFGEKFYNEGREDLNTVISRMEPSREALEKFKSLSDKRFSIYSDNDHIVPIKVLENFPKLIDAEGILIPSIGHMGSKSGITEIPEVLEILGR